MAIELPRETRAELLDSIRRFAEEELDLEIGDLKAELILRYVLEEIAPTVYNTAIADAQTYFTTKVEDLEGVCYEDEQTYWKD